MDKNICFLLCSCDIYEDLWSPFCTQLIKYWPGFDMPIYLSTETKSFNFEGLTIETPLKNIKTDLSSWSKRLEALLKSMPYEYFVFMLDDFLLYDTVNVGEVENAYQIIKSNKNIGVVHLYPLIDEKSNQIRRENAIDSEYKGYHLIKNKMPYRITTQVAIWRKDYMLKILRSHESAWYFEIRGSIRSRFYKETILAIKHRIFSYPVGGLIWRGKAVAERIGFYDNDLIADIINKRGLIHESDSSVVRSSRRHGMSDVWDYVRSFTPKF